MLVVLWSAQCAARPANTYIHGLQERSFFL
jgi:hypothetical protein